MSRKPTHSDRRSSSRHVGAGEPEQDGPPPQPGDLASARAEIDELRRALAAARERERTLSEELRHRARNVLAMVRSVARQSWEEGGSQKEYAQHLQGRLDAIARYQAHLGGGGARADLENMVRDELLPTHLLDTPRCTIDGPPVRLHGKQAELVGLAIHELAVNAIKFGALAQSGRLAIDWSIDGPRLRFRWSETGVAVASVAPRIFGFGRRMIEEALPYQIGATTSFDLRPGGLTCLILLSLANEQDVVLAGSDTPAAPQRLERTEHTR